MSGQDKTAVEYRAFESDPWERCRWFIEDYGEETFVSLSYSLDSIADTLSSWMDDISQFRIVDEEGDVLLEGLDLQYALDDNDADWPTIDTDN